MEKDQAQNLRTKAVDRSKSQSSPLPSRSEIHGKNRGDRKKKEIPDKQKVVSVFWLTRLLLLSFVLLIGLTVTYKYWSEKVSTPVHSEDKKGIETVEIER
ncbi:hypothetical protein [Fictibacillus phosphorivorans]|uniref:hypothetical protein n=1 Tax=Fictibacillus phosphorivorans TaxID=1221500 RepID=UPI002040851D|nr:hypothetical protein [Fictibacillus phosphorivorans]MCM3720311.1 hypothetical protein [Fictibacillus phosphorivorans]MCM3778001.1 hypothetical protein [Fictibacillus phosphorivorans]